MSFADGCHRLYYAPQCPNCARFIDSLDRLPARDTVVKVNVFTLHPSERQHLQSVPTLVLRDGAALVGTKAFEWLRQFDGDSELESFSLGKGLPWSHVDDDMATMSFSTPYGDFQPVP